MPFPQRLQAANSSSGGDHLNVRDVPNDFKHSTPTSAAAASARTGQVITDGGPAEFDFSARQAA
jgi:hypothetical protein